MDITNENINNLYNWQEEYIFKIEKREKKDFKTISNYLAVLNNFIEFIDNHNISEIKNINIDTILDYLDHRDKMYKENEKLRFIKKYSLDILKNNDKKLINDFVKNDIKDLSKNTKLNEIKAIKIFIGYIEDYSYMKKDLKTIDFPYLKWARIKLKSERKQIKEYDIESIHLIIKYLQKRIASGRSRFDYSLSFAFKLCLFAGLRATEACNIRLMDFGKKRKSNKGDIKIDVTIRGKGNTLFTVPIGYDYIKKEIAYFNRNIKNDRELLFKTSTNKDFTRFTFYRDMEKVSVKLDLNKKSLHGFRHTYARLLNENGVDISVIQALLRHTSIATTQIYTGVSAKRVDDATNIM